MLVIPAIDLYRGKVVRLLKGDPARSTVYSDDPLAMACRWQDEGAKLLHIVDLSAALGEGDNFAIIKEIVRHLRIGVEVGGGIRDLDKARTLLSLGAERIIIGTKGLDEDFLNALLTKFGPGKIAVSVDVRDRCLAIEGWQKTTDFRDVDFLSYLRLKRIAWVIYTDIAKDGTLCGIASGSLEELRSFSDMKLILSGGVASLQDISAIKEQAPFIWGVIVGKALYEGKIKLSEALSL